MSSLFSKKIKKDETKTTYSYVVKYGENSLKYIAKISNLEELNTLSFSSEVNIIDVYKLSKDTKFGETVGEDKDLTLITRFFKGEFIPFIRVNEAIKNDKVSCLGIKNNEVANFEYICKEMVRLQKDGVLLVQGVPFLADRKNTYYFELNGNGIIARISPLDALLVSADEKYNNIIQGNESEKTKPIKRNTTIDVEDLTKYIK